MFDSSDGFEPGSGLLVALLMLLLAFFLAMIWLAMREDAEWDGFKELHACKKVAEVSGSVFNTLAVDPKGVVTVGVGTTPGKTGWACDDGVTYYR